MSAVDDGGQAFPRPYTAGMTLRDYFAGQALASIPLRAWDDQEDKIAAWAKCAYACADAMLKERAKVS